MVFKSRNRAHQHRRKGSVPTPRSNPSSSSSAASSRPEVRKPVAPPLPPEPGVLEGAFTLIHPSLQAAVAESGYRTPTPIQEQTIAPLLAGRDMLGCAQTGTGKTAAFTLPILQLLNGRDITTARNRPRALILAPTRELAAQIADSIQTYGKYLPLTHTVIFGGVGQHPQVTAMHRGPDIVVATPGRLLDLMQQGHVNLQDIEVFVLDEADRMMDMGFIHDVKKIIAKLPAQRHSLFFSATMSPEVIKLAHTLLTNPVSVTIAPNQPAVERIGQKVMFVDRGNKDTLLAEMLKNPAIDKVIVFVQMKHVANKVVEKLAKAGIPAACIHGNKSQGARTQAMDSFRAGRIHALVATDIAARGIDVDGITHVVNYDLPNEPETYVHRIGRTARAGADGDAVSFCAADERDALRDIEKLIRKSIPVDASHGWHSSAAQHATGAAARPLPKTQQGRGRGGQQGGGGRSGGGRSSPSGGSRGGGAQWRASRHSSTSRHH